jgi:hypothetical protein
VKFDETSTVLIGDTPRDVEAGRDGGAYVVAVASDSDSADVLREAGADVVLPDLRDTGAVVEAVTGLVRSARPHPQAPRSATDGDHRWPVIPRGTAVIRGAFLGVYYVADAAFELRRRHGI